MNNLVMWKCKDGREIAVRDMSDDHLVNTDSTQLEERAEKLALPKTTYNGEPLTSWNLSAANLKWFLPVQLSAMEAVAKARGLRF